MFEVGKVYQTRNGKSLVRVRTLDPVRTYSVLCENVAGEFLGSLSFRPDGSWHKGESCHDLVSEWTKPILEFPQSNGDGQMNYEEYRRQTMMMAQMTHFNIMPTMMGRQEPDPAKEKVESVSWSDIIGLEDAKMGLQEAIEAPYLHKEVYQHFNIKPPKGVLLYGPPGCGKTMLGKAAAASMAKVHNKPYREGFFYFNGAEMIGPHFSSEVDWMKNAFKKAEAFYSANGYPAILFFDECDSMLPDRSRTNFFVKNAVNIFLSKMDGMDNAKAFIILATNNHHELDEAATRAGRIDRKIYVGRPEKPAAMAIVKSALEKKPIAAGHTIDELVAMACGELYSEFKLVGDKELFHKLNGAMIVGLVEIAAGLAFRKALKANGTEGFDVKEYGIGMEEIKLAASEIHREQVNLLKNKPVGQEEFIKAATNAIKKAAGEDTELDLDNLP